MQIKTKLKNAAIAANSAARPEIPKELLYQFVTGPMTGEAVNAASMAFKKALIERTIGGASWVTTWATPPALQTRTCGQPAQRHQRQDRAHG